MGVHLLSVTVYNPIDPGFDPHKSRKSGPNLDTKPWRPTRSSRIANDLLPDIIRMKWDIPQN